MTYCFRIRFFLSGDQRVNLADEEVALALPPEQEERVMLRGYGMPPTPIHLTSHLVVEGREYLNVHAALAAGERWRSILEKAFAASHLGADFGDRGPTSVLTDAGAKMYEAQLGQPVLNDSHGVMAFKREPRPRFFASSATATVSRSGQKVLEAITRAQTHGARFTPQEPVAYDLFSASFALSAADARFVMLMMAVETMIELAPRLAVARAHVSQLMRLTDQADLPASDKASILGTLQWLSKQSISQGGRQLASRLEPRTYLGEPPRKFFTACYDLRSKLVHGTYPRPPFEEVNAKAGALEIFVRDLLAGELIEENN